MKVEKFKVLLYLKKSEPDKTGKAPIMGRITLNRTMAQFSCKLSCTPGLWNARESRLNGKSREAVETNEKIERLLLAVHSAFNSLMERKRDFDAAAVRDMFQGNAGMQMTLLKLLDRHNGEMKARVGVDRAPTTLSTYLFTYRTLSEFIKAKFKVPDLVFGQLNEQFIRDYQDFILLEKGYAVDTLRGYLAILKKICRIAYKEGHSEKYHFCHFKLPKQKETTPKALSRENFEKLRDLEIPEKRRSHVITRDLFLFACYTGTAYADAVSITQKINPAGYRNINLVADMLKAEIIKDKKAEKLIAEMKGANSIDQVKNMANAVSDSVKHITFSAPAYVSVTRASEPALGAYASKAEVNKLTGPIKGNAGVYMIQVYNKEKSAEEFDAKNEENNLSNMAGRYASSFINDLYKKAEVKDDRYLYF